MRARVNALVLLVVASSGLAGCLTTVPEVWQIDELRAFTATFRIDEGTGQEKIYAIGFGAPVTIMDRDLQHRTAHPLTLTRIDEAHPGAVYVFFLDGDLRVVREDRPCVNQAIPGECTHAEASYGVQGALPPLGLFFPNHLEMGGGEFRYSLWSMEWRVTPAVETSEGELTLAVPNDDAIAPRWQMGWLNMVGTFSYVGGEQVPTSYTRIQEGKSESAQRVSYELQEAVPRAERWPKATGAPPSGATKAIMFPGETQVVGAAGSSPREALDWLLESDPEAVQLLADGCVQLYRSIRAFAPESGIAPLDWLGYTLFPPATDHRFHILGSDGGGKEWVVRYDPGIQGGYEVKEKRESNLPPFCSGRPDSPIPELTIQAFHQRVSRLQVSAHPQSVPSHGYRVGPPVIFQSAPDWVPPEHGWEQYWIVFMPDYVDVTQMTFSYIPYFISVAAAAEWLDLVYLHPDDIKRMDTPA